MGRRQRRVLYEVVQPSKEDLSLWKTRPTTVTPEPDPLSPSAPKEPAKVPHAGVSRAAYAQPAEASPISVSRQTIAICAAAVVMLVLVAFSAGRHFEASRSDPGEDRLLTATDDGNADSDPAQSGGEPGQTAGAAPAPTANGNGTPARPVDSARNGAPAKPETPALKQGYHYVVVQHFGSKRQAAQDAADYLRAKGVACTVVAGRGKDYRVLATDAFLIDQSDSAAGQRERQRADRLRQRIREIGEEYNTYLTRQKKPGLPVQRLLPAQATLAGHPRRRLARLPCPDSSNC